MSKVIEIGLDERCMCSCVDICPLGKRGMQYRCSVQELEAAGHQTARSVPLPKKTKNYRIIINGTEKVVAQNKLSYEDIVMLAYPHIPNFIDMLPTVTFYYKNNKKGGSVRRWQSVKVTNNLVLNVINTNQA